MPDIPEAPAAPEPGPRWLPLAEAAPRLGFPTAEALRKRAKRGRAPCPARQDNQGRWWLLVPDTGGEVVAPSDQPSGQPRPEEQTAATVELAELRARVEGLEALVEAQRRHIDDLRAELARRRWPGLRRWWRRFVEGEG